MSRIYEHYSHEELQDKVEELEEKLNNAFVAGKEAQKLEDIRIIRLFFSTEFENVIDALEEHLQ